MNKQQILIVDDEAINREILKTMFDEYDRLEAENGREAIEKIVGNRNLVLILLDISMPVMSGFDVLEYMKEHELLDRIPVILITGETVIDSEDKAYTYGVADVIHKPFYPHIVKKRSQNIIELYQSKLNMERRLKEQEKEIRAQEKEIRENNEAMLEALSSIVESRSLETGEHTRRIKQLTGIILKYLTECFPKYGLTKAAADQIAEASVLHDIGKIGIPDAILLKPGRLTPEEFEIMKTHTTIGCEMLEKSYRRKDSDFYRYSYEICRHHHERWDGGGYPDHLAGDDIPISAQIVSVADVYDALVSPRVYKKAFEKDKAFDMIINGECGKFSPDVLECFRLAKEDFFNCNCEVIKILKFV
ncbi:MAG: response regulator [Eubacterium sp.]|nr:response regulator [Eubacterium sp.]MCI8919121.1 response regulator [Eubacterium sp.]